MKFMYCSLCLGPGQRGFEPLRVEAGHQFIPSDTSFENCPDRHAFFNVIITECAPLYRWSMQEKSPTQKDVGKSSRLQCAIRRNRMKWSWEITELLIGQTTRLSKCVPTAPRNTSRTINLNTGCLSTLSSRWILRLQLPYLALGWSLFTSQTNSQRYDEILRNFNTRKCLNLRKAIKRTMMV